VGTPQYHSLPQEMRIARVLKTIFGNIAKRQPGSGNQAHSPNDVAVTNHLHVECKTTESRSMTVHYEWIAKAVHHGLQFGVPIVVAINFNKISNVDYFIVKDDDYYNLLRTQVEHQKLLDELSALRTRMNRKSRAYLRETDGLDAYESQV
jgi:Holliday junction resolvase